MNAMSVGDFRAIRSRHAGRDGGGLSEGSSQPCGGRFSLLFAKQDVWALLHVNHKFTSGQFQPLYAPAIPSVQFEYAFLSAAFGLNPW